MSLSPAAPKVVTARPTPQTASFLGSGERQFGLGSGIFKRKPTPVIGQSNTKGRAKPSLLGG